jgi:hypothetical protein
MKLKFLSISALNVCLVCCCLNLKAQTSEGQYFLPQLAPRSPNASAIEKFGTYQVNEFTGVPDISIPLYTIEAGGLQVPVTLSYHASGIKATDVASCVGLGWSLSSSGQISRRTFGIQDDGPFGYLNGFMRQAGTYPSTTLDGVSYMDSVATGKYDTRPDLFSYDFPGHGGKFFFDGSPGGNFVPRLVPFAPVKISYNFTPNVVAGLNSFNISDEHGNIYAFGGTGALETTESSSGGVSSGGPYGSAWKLQTMISQNRRDTISFAYQQDIVYYPTSDTEIFTVTDNLVSYLETSDYTASYSSSPTYIGNINETIELLPQQINFKNGKVVFDLDSSPRTDLPGTGSTAYGLADMKVYQYNYGTKAMELQKTIVFFKSNFSNGSPRLRLDSIEVQDKAGAVMQHYVFNYNTGISMPDYMSHNQDYWGYYNGATGVNNTMFTPTQTITYTPTPGGQEPVNIGGANRNCDSTGMQADVLTGIHYPTGGYSTFTYQTNQWDSSGVVSLAGGLRIRTISSYDGINPTPIVKTYVYNSARQNFLLDYDYFQTHQTHRYYILQRSSIDLAETATVRSFSSNPHCDLEGWDAATVVYPSVTEYIGTPGNNIGRTDYTFTDMKDAVSDASQAGSLVYLSSFYVRGHLLTKKQFINKGGGSYQPVELTSNTYTAFPAVNYQYVGLTIYKLNFNEGLEGNPITPGQTTDDDTNSFFPNYYAITSDDNYLTGTTTSIYDTKDTTKYTTSTTTYNYDNEVHQQVTRSYHTDSKGNTLVTRTRYPADYTSGNAVIDSMVSRNMQAEPIEKYDTLKNVATSVNAITSAQLNVYAPQVFSAIMPSKIYTLSVAQPLTNFVPATVSSGTLNYDSRYVQMISFDSYDGNNNLVQYTPRNATPVSMIWDYQNVEPIAQVKNAISTAIAYTSFEADGKGGWIFSGTPIADPNAPTGSRVYPLSAGNITYYSAITTVPAILSYWSNAGAATVYATGGGGYLTSTSLNSVNGYTYFECPIGTGMTAMTISGSSNIDELRLYPAVAQMTTYTYNPSGVSSITDTKGMNSYFQYDFAQRLKYVQDWAGNIIKGYGYHTYDQIFANQVQTQNFTRNNCPPYTSPGSLNYTVPVNKYYSSTLAAANTDAAYDLMVNGQAKANANCGCPVTMISVELTNTSGVASYPIYFSGISSPYYFPNSGSAYISVPAGTYSTVTAGPLGSGTYTFTMGTRPVQSNVHYATFDTVSIIAGSSDLSITLN